MKLHDNPMQGMEGCRVSQNRRAMQCAGRGQRRRRFGLTVSEPGMCGAPQRSAKAESRCACLRTPKAALVRPATMSLAGIVHASMNLLRPARRDTKVTIASFVRHEAILTSPIKQSLSYDCETNQRINQDALASDHTSI